MNDYVKERLLTVVVDSIGILLLITIVVLAFTRLDPAQDGCLGTCDPVPHHNTLTGE